MVTAAPRGAEAGAAPMAAGAPAAPAAPAAANAPGAAAPAASGSLVVREVEVKSVLSKSNLPVCEYSVNPYVGCTHGCRYCYASGGRQLRSRAHNPSSLRLLGEEGPEDTVRPLVLKGN